MPHLYTMLYPVFRARLSLHIIHCVYTRALIKWYITKLECTPLHWYIMIMHVQLVHMSMHATSYSMNTWARIQCYIMVFRVRISFHITYVLALIHAPKVFHHAPKTLKGYHPLDFCLPSWIFQKYSVRVCSRSQGSRNPTAMMTKFYLYCMTLKIKVKHLFAWPFLSLVVNMIQTRSWCQF